MIYFDNAATTPVAADVAETIEKAFREQWGNPSSLHRVGFQAEKVLEEARGRMAEKLGIPLKSLIFTSGASESLNTVLRGVATQALLSQKMRAQTGSPTDAPNIVISAVEHAAVYQTAQILASYGIEVREIPVDATGQVTVADVEKRVDAHTLLVAVMHVNNELGTIFPVAEIATMLHQKSRALFLVDGTQALGKLPVNLSKIGCDFYVASGHKIHAPKGIGMLYVRPGVTVSPLITGGPQEYGRRAGTENVPYILGFVQAFLAMEKRRSTSFDPAIVKLHEKALARAKAITGSRINSPAAGSPYILNIAFTGIKAEVLMHFMEMEEMYLSSGSACSKGKVSRILQAIHLPEAYLDGALRLSFSRENREEEVDPFFDRLETSIAQIRSITGGNA